MASCSTPTRPTDEESTGSGACTRGSTAPLWAATRPAFGGAATTNTSTDYSSCAYPTVEDPESNLSAEIAYRRPDELFGPGVGRIPAGSRTMALPTTTGTAPWYLL